MKSQNTSHTSALMSFLQGGALQAPAVTKSPPVSSSDHTSDLYEKLTALLSNEPVSTAQLTTHESLNLNAK